MGDRLDHSHWLFKLLPCLEPRNIRNLPFAARFMSKDFKMPTAKDAEGRL